MSMDKKSLKMSSGFSSVSVPAKLNCSMPLNTSAGSGRSVVSLGVGRVVGIGVLVTSGVSVAAGVSVTDTVVSVGTAVDVAASVVVESGVLVPTMTPLD